MISKLAGLEAMHKKNQDELVQFQEMDPDLFDQKSKPPLPSPTPLRPLIPRDH